MKLDLVQMMRSLYETNEYYISIPPRKIINNNSKNIIDPDGLTRNIYDIEEKNAYLKNNKYIVDYLRTLKPGEILDIGCGFGWILSSISSKWNKFCIEPNSRKTSTLPNDMKIINDIFKDGIYSKDMFNVILCHHVIEHVEDPNLFLKELKNILKNDGLLILGTPDFDNGCARRFGNNYRLLDDPTHISLFSNDSMHRFLRDNNFAIKNVHYPFFETQYFNKKNLHRLFDNNLISPPFYGNYMTFFCKNLK